MFFESFDEGQQFEFWRRRYLIEGGETPAFPLMLFRAAELFAKCKRLLSVAAGDEDGPDPEEVGDALDCYRSLPFCDRGGSLADVIEDAEVESDLVAWCEGFAIGRGDVVGSAVCAVLRSMSAWGRVEAIQSMKS